MLKLINLKKNYPLYDNKVVEALKGINIDFDTKGFVSILGPSGCGKTTLLNVVGGLDQYTSGDLVIDGKSTKNFTSQEWDAYRNRKIGFVFQSYNLISHLTCLENVMFGMILGGVNSKIAKEKATLALKNVGLEEQINKLPNQLSGGQAQRVAIARAVVNDPEIILADEPTGALDGKSSVVVMDILKELSKTKLVVLVTHNDKLALDYSDRIIKMLDGEIVSDTKEGYKGELPKAVKKIEKSKLSIKECFKFSFKTIKTKKVRSLITSLACSVGIIGVGLVLALSNGFSTYVTKVETQSSTNMPITISASSTVYKKNPDYVAPTKFPDTDSFQVYDTSSNSMYIATEQTNNLTQDYVDYINNIDNTKYKGAIASALVNYSNVNHHMYTKNGNVEGEADTYSCVYPYYNVGSSISSVLASVTGLPKTIFHQFYGDEDYIRQSYDVLYGSYPKDSDTPNENGEFEIALVVDSYNRIDYTTMKRMGFFTTAELDKMIENKESIKFSDIVNHDYTFYLNEDLFPIESALSFKANRSSDKQTLSVKDSDGNLQSYEISIPVNTIKQYRYSQYSSDYQSFYDGTYKVHKSDGTEIGTAKAYKLKITGVLRVNESAIVDYMPTSLCYGQGFRNFIYQKANETSTRDNTKSTIAFDAKSNCDVSNIQAFFDLYNSKNCFSILKQIGLIDEDYKIPSWAESLEEASLDDFLKAFGNSASWYDNYATAHSDYSLTADTKTVSYSTFVTEAGYLGSIFQEDDDMKDLVDEISKLLENITDGKVISSTKEYTEIKEKLENDTTLLPRFWSYFASKLANYHQITSVVIFPTSLSTKTQIKEYLDLYNEGKEDSEMVSYSDIIGDFTESLYSIISIISVVLVCFSSISLVVSSVMSAVVTYAAVLERSKEIGILRSLGARKKDVGRLFEVENVILGLFSGLIGVILVYLISIPANAIIASLLTDYNIGNICNLNIITGLGLILLSSILSFIASLIPSRLAAKKDPVKALRTE